MEAQLENEVIETKVDNMNQKKTGAFIAECRKRQKLTQLELAEKLGVTDRSVSNWENGVCLPDASLYRLLCDILQVSVNELFAGEFVCDENYKSVAEHNLLVMLEHRLYDTNSKDITFDEFQNALKRISEVTLLLQRFENKEKAINYLVNETGISEEECTSAYDFYIKMFKNE